MVFVLIISTIIMQARLHGDKTICSRSDCLFLFIDAYVAFSVNIEHVDNECTQFSIAVLKLKD